MQEADIDKSQKTVIVWFRRNLRLEDNKVLTLAHKSGLHVLPLFIFDQNILDPLPKEDARLDFIHSSLLNIHEALEAFNSGLLLRKGTPVEIFSELFTNYNVQELCYAEDFEPYAIDRDNKIKKLADRHGVKVKTCLDHVMFHPKQIKTNEGNPYHVYTPYSKSWLSKLKSEHHESAGTDAKSMRWIEYRERMLTLEDIGFRKTNIEVPKFNNSETLMKNYDETRNFPARNGTSRLSVHLRFGTVSIRKIVRDAIKINDTTFLKELIWREFFITVLYHHPETIDTEFKPKYRNLPWNYDEKKFKRWCNGQTGIPIVDAGMRELNNTGFMHNRVRMITACWLTKNMLHDWRLGERYFAEKLLDFELASNVGNWQWAAGTGVDAAPYFRIFNPFTQADKFDPKKAYIEEYVPEWNSEIYPEPVVDYKESRKKCLDFFKEHTNDN